MSTLVTCEAMAAGYAGHPMVHDISLTIAEGEVVTVLGPNGAGKTTTVHAIAGDVDVYAGEVRYGDRVMNKLPLNKRAGEGMCLVTEERSVFMQLTVDENLRVGRCDTARALEIFPELEPLLGRRAGLLSGGEQQMLTLGRALARRPRILLIDELSLGLAPLVVQRLLAAVRSAADNDGVAVLLVEQHVRHALRVADRAHVLERGRITHSGTSAEVAAQLRSEGGGYLKGTVQS